MSKFVIGRVEDSIRREEGEESYLSRLELIKRLNQTEDDLKKTRQENRLLRQLADNLDKELRRYRAKPFAEESFRGTRQFDKDLVSLLRKGGSHSQEEVLAHLEVEPSETEMVKAVAKQLEALENYGLVEYVGRGWRWRG